MEKMPVKGYEVAVCGGGNDGRFFCVGCGATAKQIGTKGRCAP